MKLIILVVFLASLGLSLEAQNCNNDCLRSGINYLCGKTVRRGREIRCTFKNPCEMDLLACQKREEWKKDTTGRCTRDSEECRR